ncbi:MAG: membrane protein insertase YidC [Gemmatimonadota bacterium]|nr:membrane protein insertase YidC [Gemmatimonadota bacterium]
MLTRPPDGERKEKEVGQDGQEKRAFFAILLAMAVLFVWSVLFPMQAPRETPHEESAATGTHEQVETEESRTVQEEPAPSAVLVEGGLGTPSGLLVSNENTPTPRAPGNDPSPVRVEVVGENMRVVLDGLGARATEITLFDFEKAKGVPVQLIPEHGSGALGSILSVGTREISLDRHVFRLSSDSGQRQEGERRIVWELALDGMTLRKTYVIPPRGYSFRVEQEIVDGGETVTGWGLSWAGGIGVTEENRRSTRGAYYRGSVLAEGKVQRLDAGKVEGNPRDFPGRTWFVGVQNKYFLGAIVPDSDARGPARLWAVEVEGARDVGSAVAGSIRSERQTGITADHATYNIYAGPLDYQGLSAIGSGLEGTVDMGNKWTRPLSKIILAFLIWLHGFIPNYGVVIILFSTLTKILFIPLTHKSTQSMKKMSSLKPELDALKEKYGGDKQKVSEETMKMYKKHGVNPLGGCFPMLLQMPIFIALYSVLLHTIEIRGEPFVGWIRDLSQPDIVFDLPAALPMIGSGVPILPIVMGITSYFQSKQTMADPSQKAMVIFMPLFMTLIFFTFPSGLVLYWLVNNVLTIAQQAMLKVKPSVPATES